MKSWKIAPVMISLVFLPCTGQSTVIGAGTYTLHAPDLASITYGYGGGYFGYIDHMELQNTSNRVFERAYFDSTGSGNLTSNSTTVAGNWDQTTGNAEFNFTTASPDPGVIRSSVGAGFNGRVDFTGTIDENFGYDYTFTGLNDDGGTLHFGAQMEIYYLDDVDGDNDRDRVYVYSDYYNSPPTTNRVTSSGTWYYDSMDIKTKFTSLSFSESGTYTNFVRFGDLASYGDRVWHIGTDFGGAGYDDAGNGQTTAPVPEPSTMILFGAGLVGLVGSRIKRKKK